MGGGRREEREEEKEKKERRIVVRKDGLRLSQKTLQIVGSYRTLCDTNLNSQRRYAPRVSDIIGIGGRFDRNPHHLICRICRIGEPTLVRYLRSFEQGGLDGLKQLGYKGRPSRLTSHQVSLEEHFRHHLPHTCAQAQEEIEKLTGVRRGLTQVRLFLRRLNMNYRKTGFVPGKADTPEKQAEQEDFLKKNSNRSWRRRKPESGWFFS